MILGVYGAGGLGTEYENLAEVINSVQHRWESFVFIDDDPEKAGKTLANLAIMSFKDSIEKYGLEEIEFILAIGEPAVKDIVYKKVRDAGARLTNLIYPDFVIPRTFKHGEGLVVHKLTGVPVCSEFGNNVLIQGKAVMGHNLTLGDNVVISSLAFVGGDVTIEKNSYIGPGSCIRNGLHIGENVIVGMGSVVTKDIPDNAVVYGNPAKVMRYNETGRVFSK